MNRILISDVDLAELQCSVHAVTGEEPDLQPFRPRRSHNEYLGYFGSSPMFITFELAALLARKAYVEAYNSGYQYSIPDVFEELRTLISHINSPLTEAVGSEIVYYWPTVSIAASSVTTRTPQRTSPP